MWVGCFYKVVDQRVSCCIQVVLLCQRFPGIFYYLGHFLGEYFRAFFRGYFSLLFIITFILLSTSVQFLCTHLRFLQLPHTYITIVPSFVFTDLVDLLLSINLPCIILLSFTLKIFYRKILTLCLKSTVKIVKNILSNSFKRNVNTMN